MVINKTARFTSWRLEYFDPQVRHRTPMSAGHGLCWLVKGHRVLYSALETRQGRWLLQTKVSPFSSMLKRPERTPPPFPGAGGKITPAIWMKQWRGRRTNTFCDKWLRWVSAFSFSVLSHASLLVYCWHLLGEDYELETLNYSPIFQVRGGVSRCDEEESEGWRWLDFRKQSGTIDKPETAGQGTCVLSEGGSSAVRLTTRWLLSYSYKLQFRWHSLWWLKLMECCPRLSQTS